MAIYTVQLHFKGDDNVVISRLNDMSFAFNPSKAHTSADIVVNACNVFLDSLGNDAKATIGGNPNNGKQTPTTSCNKKLEEVESSLITLLTALEINESIMFDIQAKNKGRAL
jgi:TPP-dependent indolepyruvate ferredoxin oxidoreductase alpha subunit